MNAARLLIVAGLTLLLACTSAKPQKQTTGKARGAELLAPFKQQLKTALLAGMQESPVTAISVCQDQAPKIAASLSTAGVIMGRSSDRLRNPGNSAPEWVDPILESYLGKAEDHAPALVALANNRMGYVEPIKAEPLCLTCHGKNLAPDVAAQIAAAYPEDQATGFDAGDLRGVFWVEYPEGL